MRVIFTGQSGIDKHRVVENLVDHLRVTCGYRGDSSDQEASNFLSSYSFESFIAPHYFGITEWLQMPNENMQNEEWKEGFTDLLDTIKRDSAKNIFLSMHSVFFRYSKFFSPINWDQIREFNPDLFITFIDDVQDIWWRLMKRHDIFPPSPTYRLRELLAWRSVETMVTEIISQRLNPQKPIPHYVVAVKHPVLMLQRLLMEPRSLRIYAAYPISDIRNDKIMKEVINAHRNNLHKRFIVFDPISIDEYILESLNQAQKQDDDLKKHIVFKKEDRWSVRSKACDLPLLSDKLEHPEYIEIDREQINEVSDEMKDHIEWRDYRLINQAHCIATYRPNYNKKTSRGVSSEIMYALFSGLQIFNYWPPEDGNYVPFGRRGVYIGDYSEFIDELEKHQISKQERFHDLSHESEFIGSKREVASETK